MLRLIKNKTTCITLLSNEHQIGDDFFEMLERKKLDKGFQLFQKDASKSWRW